MDMLKAEDADFFLDDDGSGAMRGCAHRANLCRALPFPHVSGSIPKAMMSAIFPSTIRVRSGLERSGLSMLAFFLVRGADIRAS